MKILAMDMGKINTVICYFDSSNISYRFETVRTVPNRIHDAIGSFEPERVVLEIGPAAGWVCDMCHVLGVAVEVANTNHEAWRWKNVKKKGDREDALKLARLSAARDLPVVHVPKKAIRQKRSLIAYRQNLLKRRVAITNNIRSIFDREGIVISDGDRAWNKAGMAFLESQAKEPSACGVEELWRGELYIELKQLAAVKEAMEQIESKLDEIGKTDRQTQILMSVPGIGPRLSEAFAAAIDDASRFKSRRQIGSYFGLTPRRYHSGKTDRQGKISGCGNKIVRSMLIQVSWLGLRYNPWMLAIYKRVMAGREKRKKIAIVAVARHLAVLCWVLLKEDRMWESRAKAA